MPAEDISLKEINTVERVNPLCTCHDEFKVLPCPVHYDQEAEDKYNNRVVITDDNMVPEEIRQWAGYCFICPRCGESAIMDMMHHCGNCGVEVVVQSKKVTDFVNKLMERNTKLKEKGLV